MADLFQDSFSSGICGSIPGHTAAQAIPGKMKPQPNAMNLEQIAYVLYLETWTPSVEDEDVADLTDERLQSLGAKWRTECLPNRQSEHCGDCTNVPVACQRCQMDALFKTAERILRSAL